MKSKTLYQADIENAQWRESQDIARMEELAESVGYETTRDILAMNKERFKQLEELLLKFKLLSLVGTDGAFTNVQDIAEYYGSGKSVKQFFEDKKKAAKSGS